MCVSVDIPRMKPLELKNNHNGDNACWINAPLYTFLAHDEVFNLKKNFGKNTFYGKLLDIFYDFRKNRDGGWINENYKKIYNLISNSNDGFGLDDFPKWGNYGNGASSMLIFGECFGLSTGNNLKLESSFINSYEELCDGINGILNIDGQKKKLDGYVCVSFIRGTQCISDINGQNVSHYEAFARIDNKTWRNMDSGNTNDTDIREIFVEKCSGNKKYSYNFLFVKKEKI